MAGDIGTRKGAKVADVGPMSPWIQGMPWMKGEEAKFPLKTIDEIVFGAKEKSEASKEEVLEEFNIFSDEICSHVTRVVPSEVGERYKFSKYLINPNRFRFCKIVRILAIVLLFLQKVILKCNKARSFEFLKIRQFNQDVGVNNGQYIVAPIHVSLQTHIATQVAVIHLPENIMNAARGYLFQKAATEVKHFVDPSKYKNNSVWKDGILYHTSRILSMQEIDGQSSLSDVCLDLSAATFCVPITDAL